jgi:hypothetical protein
LQCDASAILVEGGEIYIAGVGFQSGEVVVLQLAESEAFQLLMPKMG